MGLSQSLPVPHRKQLWTNKHQVCPSKEIRRREMSKGERYWYCLPRRMVGQRLRGPKSAWSGQLSPSLYFDLPARHS